MSESPLPSTEHVDVWRIDLRQEMGVVTSLHDALTENERRPADRLRIEAKRREFIVTRTALRNLLGNALDQHPHEINIETESHGRPVVNATIAGQPLRFNVTHSGDLALIAVTLRDQVGIDIEHTVRKVQYERLADRYFSDQEVQQLAAVDNAQTREAFFNGWTRKEALLKAVGSGLTLGLKSFDVELRPQHQPQLRDARCPELKGTWSLAELPVENEYQAAVAVQRRGLSIRLHQMNVAPRQT